MLNPNIRMLLTGGTGFFGKALLRFWHKQAESGGATPQVTVLSRNPSWFRRENPELSAAPWLKFLSGDITQPESLIVHRAALEGVTHLLHAATDSTLGPKLSPIRRFDQILEGTRNILDLAVTIGVQRFLLCSSGGVYGPPPIGIVHLDESYNGIPDPLLSSNAYSIAKRGSEHLSALYAEEFGLNLIVARCFAFVGRDLPRNVHFAIGNFIRDALERTEITVAGDGTPIRSYLDQRDLAEWLTVLLERGQSGRAYNVGSDEGISVADLAALVRDVLSPGKKVRILGKHEDAQSSSQHRNVYVPSIKRAREELGLNVTIPLRRAIGEAARGYK